MLFGLVIFFGLRFRKRKFARSLELTAVDIWPQIEDAGFDFAGLRYGVWQDPGYPLGHDRQGFQRPASREDQLSDRQGPWIFVETPEGNFEADALPALRQSVSLRARERRIAQPLRILGDYLAAHIASSLNRSAFWRAGLLVPCTWLPFLSTR